MRLIDADELIEIAKKDKAVNAALADLKDIKDIVNATTTIEAEPVKHSKWLVNKVKAYSEWFYVCSNCGWGCHCNAKLRYDYCPRCGAKMEKNNGD